MHRILALFVPLALICALEIAAQDLASQKATARLSRRRLALAKLLNKPIASKFRVAEDGRIIEEVTAKGSSVEGRESVSGRAEQTADSKTIVDLGQVILEACPPMLCTGLDCALVTVPETNCTLCACPIGSPARGCDPMPFIVWIDLMRNGCPSVRRPGTRTPSQRVHRWFRRYNRFTSVDECEPYVFPYCSEIDYNLWRSPRTKDECEFYCYSFEEQNEMRLEVANDQN